MPLARATLPTFAALYLAATSACGAPTSKTNPGSGVSPPAAVALPDAQRGFTALLGKATIDGGNLSREARPTAVVVFASWCGPCRHELKTLGTLRDAYPALRIIGVNAYEEYGNRSDASRLEAFVQANAPWLTQIVHADSALLRSFGRVPKIPTLFIYDAQGQVVAEFRRNKRLPPSHDELEAAIKSAVATWTPQPPTHPPAGPAPAM
jgi:thiol-disulfide isomerase/thioredoxin